MSERNVEFTAEDDEIDTQLKLQDFSQAVLWGTDWTVETILAQLSRGNIELNPRFQRRDAWSRKAKSRFIESVILGLPVPQVVLAESREQRGRYIILDGKQRLLSLMQFAGFAEGPTNNFGLSGLDVRTDLARKRFSNLESDLTLRADFDAFLTHTIRTTVIRNWPSLAFLHVVFQRLNTGSLKLSPQELRQAIVPGPFTDAIDDATVDAPETWDLLGRTEPDPRMRDVELVVRAVSFRLRLTSYTGRMKEFLDRTCQYFNANWGAEEGVVTAAINDFKEGVSALQQILKSELARKRDSSLFNRSIFDALIYYAMDAEVRGLMLAKPEAVVKAYSETLASEVFQVAVESDTAGIPHTADRLNIWGETLSRYLKQDIVVPVLQENAEGQQRFVVAAHGV